MMTESKVENSLIESTYEERTGEEELKKIHMQLYGGGVKARTSFISVLFRRRGTGDGNEFASLANRPSVA